MCAAAREIARERSGIVVVVLERPRPSLGGHNQSPIQRDARLLDDLRHRPREIFVLADAVTKALHDDPAAKSLAIVIERDQVAALGGAEQLASRGVSAGIQVALDSLPIERIDPLADCRARSNTIVHGRRIILRGTQAAFACTNCPTLSIACCPSS